MSTIIIWKRKRMFPWARLFGFFWKVNKAVIDFRNLTLWRYILYTVKRTPVWALFQVPCAFPNLMSTQGRREGRPRRWLQRPLRSGVLSHISLTCCPTRGLWQIFVIVASVLPALIAAGPWPLAHCHREARSCVLSTQPLVILKIPMCGTVIYQRGLPFQI